MKSAGKARSNGLYRHIRTSKEIIRNLLNDSFNNLNFIMHDIYIIDSTMIFVFGQYAILHFVE